MRATLTELLNTLGELEDFIKSIGPVTSLLSNHSDMIVLRYLTIRRRLDFAAFIVALYAAFEKFVEDLAWSHAEHEVTRTKYSKLHEKLQMKHLRESAELLHRRLGEGRYAGITDRQIVSNLHDCLSDKTPYLLNRHAIIDHGDSNLRADKVHELFLSIGIDDINKGAREADPLVDWYRNIKGSDVVSSTVVEERLGALVSRRNQIAHDGGAPNDWLGASEMQELLDFVRAYCRSLWAVIAGIYLERTYIKIPGASVRLESVEDPKKDGYVIIVRASSCRLKVGQPVIGKRANRVDRWGNIEEIHDNDRSVPEVDVGATAKELGIRLDFQSTKGTSHFLLPNTDDLIWS